MTPPPAVVSTEDPIPLREALIGVPRMDAARWRASGPLRRWLVAARASVLAMTLSSAMVGGLFAALAAAADPFRWLVCTAGLLLAHATNNLLNDLTDTRRGLDRGDYFRVRYGTHVLEQGLVSLSELWRVTLLTGFAALAIGLALAALVGPAVLWVLVPGSVVLLLYTWPLKHWGLGEVAVWLVWGPLMVAGTALVTAGTWLWSAVAVGALFGLGPTLVIFGKHLDKLDFDRHRDVRTLPVRLGDARSRLAMRAMLLLLYAGTLGLLALGVLAWPVLAVLGTVGRARALWRRLGAPYPDRKPADWPEAVGPLWFAAHAFAFVRAFGLWFTAAMLAGWVLQALG